MKLLKKIHIIRIIVFIIGLVMCAYPLVSSLVQWHYQSTAVATYKNLDDISDDIDIQEELTQAEVYNEKIYELNPLVSGLYDNTIGNENYNKLLNIYGNGVMGSIEIPSIGVYLPIYHGTDDDVLSNAIGHVQNSSLPVGGQNTHTVLTGHRGSPTAKLFTRLDEMVVGDLFYLNVLGETLAYEVTDISVIEPEELESLSVVEGKDLVTLLTCTPYGINTHRLLVTGERTEYVDEVYKDMDSKIMSSREVIFSALPIMFLIIGFVVVVKYIKKERKDHDENK